MTKLNDNESVRYQLLLEPINSKKVSILRHKVLRHEDVIPHLNSKRSINGAKIASLINTFLFGILDILSATYHTSTNAGISPEIKAAYDKQNAAKNLKPVRSLSSFEQEQLSGIHDKLSQPLFRASIRVAVISSNKEIMKYRVTGISTALSSYATPGYQSIRPTHSFVSINRLRLTSFIRQLPSILSRTNSILSAEEVGSLYHWQLIGGKHTDNLQTSLAKSLPAPISLKGSTDFGVILGENIHHGIVTPIGLTATERERHVYIIGGTGNGKTTMLEYAIVQDILSGKGVALIDPHGDSAQKLLGYIPPERIDDVIYLNPKDIDHPVGLNLLELPKGLGESELLLEKERVTEAVISVLRKVFADDTANAHRIESILRNTIHTAFTVEDATLFTILKLLRNTDYRKEVVSKLKDEYLKDFWREEFGAAGNMQRVSMSKGVTNRIDRFQNSPIAGRMLGQVKSTINFEDIINSGKILICNFSQGGIGEDTSALFGTTILAMLKVAAERRDNIPEAERRPFYLYVDEFQNFATAPFIKMLSSSRKYKLYLTIAEQSTAQQEERRLTEAILANVSTIVCFRTGSPVDEQLILPRFEPFIEKGEIGNLSSFNFYLCIQAKDSLEPLSGETIVLSKEESCHEVERAVIRASQENYATLTKNH